MENPNAYTILAVNDIPIQSNALTTILKAAGFNVHAATNPNAAIRLAIDHDTDLIISELSRPSIEGIDLLQRVRSNTQTLDIPILVISALHLVTNDPIPESNQMDRDGYLESPYQPTTLIAKISSLIERNRFQEELQLARARYVDVFDNANDIVYTHDLEGHYTSLNKTGQMITGYSCEEAAQLEFNHLATPEDVALAKEMLARKLAGDESSTIYEISIRAKDGTVIPVEVNTQLIFRHGKPVGVQGIARDIRARKQAEEQLRQASESLIKANHRAVTEYEILLQRISQLAQVLASARDLAPIFKRLLEFTTVSLPCEALGIALYDHEQVELNPHFFWVGGQIIPIADIKPIPVTNNSNVRRAIVSGQTIIATTPANATDEQAIAPLFNYSPKALKPASAMIVPMTIMGRTIGTLEIQSTTPNAYQTQHTTALQMAANLAANTIENVRLLSREREHENQLRQAQKMEAIGHLAAGIAHDSNNILTGILGNADMLGKQLEHGDHRRKYVLDIKESVKRASTLNRQLLTFSRQQAVQEINLSLNKVIEDMERFITRLISENITINFKLRKALPQIRADKSQLDQMLMNLALNARDAMPYGGEITIETTLVHIDKKHNLRNQPTDKTQPHIQLSFSDTGTGMSAETQKQIFQPFFTTKEEGKGTGLGLATTYGIVKQSGGSIWVYSKEGEGTTFKIHFPVAQQQVDILPEIVTQPEQSHHGSQTILIAEDDHTVRHVLRDALDFAGYKIQEAANGRDAWDIFQQHMDEIQLLITDVVMPQMNGPTLALLINEIRPSIPVIYISGHSTETITNRNEPPSDIQFLEKPFDNDDVLRKVQQVLASNEVLQTTGA